MNIKYPRTFHAPWSESLTNDDKRIATMADLIGQRVVVLEKLDGENFTLKSTGCHARSCDSVHHWTRDWIKAFHAGIRADIPTGWRICGENLFAEHAIRYDDLPSYFMGFSVWDRDTALDWDTTTTWFDMLGIQHPALIFDGLFDRAAIHSAWLAYTKTLDRESEGYVIRVAGEIQHDDFKTLACKYVRAGHVGLGDSHWLYGGREIRQNGLKVVP